MDTRLILVQEEPRGPSMIVEVPVPALVVQRVKFPDIQQLRSTQGNRIVIKAMRLITAKVLTNGVSTGFVNAPLAELRKISLVLYADGWEKGQYIPLLTLNDVCDSDSATATTIPFRNVATKFDSWENVDWSKTYLQYSNNASSSGSAYVVMFDVEYVKLDINGSEIKGPS